MRGSHVEGIVGGVVAAELEGPRSPPPPGAEGLLERLRRRTPLPLAVGFGISRPEQVRALARLANGVIVGSALVAQVAAERPSQEVALLAGELAQGTGR